MAVGGASRYREFRAGLYVVLALAGLFPLAHLAAVYGWAHAVHAVAFEWTLLMGGIYLAGTVLYTFRFPERAFPGSFDYFLHSHQVRPHPHPTHT
jgi:adiponectin receptor